MLKFFNVLIEIPSFLLFWGVVWKLLKLGINGLAKIEVGTSSHDPNTRVANERARIGNVIKNGSSITIFDEQGRRTVTFSCMRHAEISGFTSNAVHVRTGNDVCVYNAEGKPGRNYNV